MAATRTRTPFRGLPGLPVSRSRSRQLALLDHQWSVPHELQKKFTSNEKINPPHRYSQSRRFTVSYPFSVLPDIIPLQQHRTLNRENGRVPARSPETMQEGDFGNRAVDLCDAF